MIIKKIDWLPYLSSKLCILANKQKSVAWNEHPIKNLHLL